MFQRYIAPPSSVMKDKASKEPAAGRANFKYDLKKIIA
jgi:hypothetical protein